jgi:hypothetical protein
MKKINFFFFKAGNVKQNGLALLWDYIMEDETSSSLIEQATDIFLQIIKASAYQSQR